MGTIAGRQRPVRCLSGNERYRTVLSQGQRHSSRNFSLRAVANEMGAPRLGIIVSRKVAKRSVDRNRGKRLLREHFRSVQDTLAPLDIVVQVRTDLRSCNNASLRAELSALMKELWSMAGFSNP